jgi:DNA-binding NarL/FixJ family response regulator
MGIKVFIVDDHFMVIEGIRSLLQWEKNIEWTGHATNADSCLSSLALQEPDVILMDINLPGKSGIDLCREVKESHPAVAVIGLSTYNQQSFIQRMMESGASGYVLKNANRQELMEAIETATRGNIYLSTEASDILKKKDNGIVLTRREKEILGLIADGMTNSQIGEKLFISTATVDSHRKNLLAKFDVRNVASLIKTAMEQKMI